MKNTIKSIKKDGQYWFAAVAIATPVVIAAASIGTLVVDAVKDNN